MNRLLNWLSNSFEVLPDRLRAHRRWVWAGLLLIVLAVGYGSRWLTIEMTLESFVIKGDSTMVLFGRFKETFGGDESVYIVYEARDGDVFSPASLEALRGIQQALSDGSGSAGAGSAPGKAPSALEHVVEVTSLLNARYMEVRGDTLISRDFIGDELPATAAAREALRRQALAHRNYPLFYLSRDSHFGAIYVRTDFGTVPVDPLDGASPQDVEAGFAESVDGGDSGEGAGQGYKMTSMGEYAEFVDAVEGIISDPAYAQALRFYPVGNPVAMGFFNDLLESELRYLLLAAVALMMLVLWILFRSASAVAWCLAIVALSAFLTLGVMGWLGVTMSLMVSILLMLILVVGIADSVHILSGYLYFRHEGLQHAAALRAVFKKSGLACLLTSLTTAAGMLALLLVPIPPIRNFGFAAALGVVLAFVLTVTLLPLLLDIWRPRAERPSHGRGRGVEGKRAGAALARRLLSMLEPFAHRYPVPVILVFVLVSVVAAYGLSLIRIDTNMVTIIKEGTKLRSAYALVDRVMGGTQNMEIFLEFGQEDALRDPGVLRAMESIQDYLETEQKAFVIRTDSLVNVAKETYQVLNENRPEMHRIPKQRQTLAQTLLLFDTADPSERERLVPDDYSQGRISVRLLNLGSMAYLDFFREVQERMEKELSPLREAYPGMKFSITGSLALLMKISDFISHSQVRSFGLALLVVTLLMFVVFGSVKAGLVAMLPNVFPVLVTFGAMGLLGIPLDTDTLIIAPVIIGIAVDDTIHFLSHYRAEMQETSSVVTAIRLTLQEVGQAIMFTSLILVLGFLVFVVSRHQGVANVGALTAGAFISALLADLLLLPSLLTLFNIRFGK